MLTSGDYVLKLMRAREHLHALNTEIEWWAAEQPYRIARERDNESGHTRLTAESVGEPPFKLAVIAGDVLHNLRSCLDILTLELAVSNCGGELPDGDESISQFPICDTSDAFTAQRKRGRIRHVATDPSAAIDALQPYHRGDKAAASTDPLAILRDLSDFDKHRRLPLITISVKIATVDIPVDSWQVAELELNFGGRLEPQTVIADYSGLIDRATGEEVDMDISLSLDVAFGDGSPTAVVGKPLGLVLSDMWRYVGQEVIGRLESHLPGGTDSPLEWPDGIEPTKLKLKNFQTPEAENPTGPR